MGGPNGLRMELASRFMSHQMTPMSFSIPRPVADRTFVSWLRGNYERLVAEHSDWRDVSGDIAACSGGYVVPNPKKNTGLVQDCETLLRVRDQLAGDAVLNWTADEKISKWRGVGTEGTPPRIVRLILVSLSPTKLTGLIPPALGDLLDLEVLSLHSNQLSGSIPPELGNLANLRDLRLSWNYLEGTIPAELGSLTRLETLDLGQNRLVGSIPPELGNLASPIGLGIDNNDLTGCVPAVLSGRLGSPRSDGLRYC